MQGHRRWLGKQSEEAKGGHSCEMGTGQGRGRMDKRIGGKKENGKKKKRGEKKVNGTDRAEMKKKKEGMGRRG